MLAADTRHLVSPTDETVFRFARPALALWLAAILATRQWLPANEQQDRMFVALLAVVVATSIAVLVMRRASRVAGYLGPFVVVADIVVISGYTYLFRVLDGAFYPAVVAAPVIWALVVRRNLALGITAAVTAAYSVGYWYGNDSASASLTLFALTVLVVPVAGSAVAFSRERQRQLGEQTAHEVERRESTNAELQQRLAELQALSEVTEIVHSTLEFDTVGSDVLEVVCRVVGVDACCLFMIDSASSETLFSATYGMEPIDSTTALYAADPTTRAEGHLTCFPVFSHDRTTVVFCASDADVNKLSDEDRIVLRAVASELVVAAENSRLYRLTQQLAETDELTGLANYRHLQAKLDHEIERARRYDKTVSLLMIDADDFKRFNDTQGHLTGDAALAELADVIVSQVREVDDAARYGGEEFSVVLPETDAAGAFVAAEKIREAVAAHRFRDAEGVPRCLLTVSVGVATFPTHSWDKDSLLKAADDALYSAKTVGKDRVRTPKLSTRHAAGHAGRRTLGGDDRPLMRDTESPAAETSSAQAPTGD